MASENPREHNNQDFQLNALFGVQGKVALITGEFPSNLSTLVPSAHTC